MPSNLRSSIKKSLTSDNALAEVEAQLFKSDLMAKALGGTTQAVDISGGGVKVNALPEEASAIVNYRIAGHRFVSLALYYFTFDQLFFSRSSDAALQSHILNVLNPTAQRYNLSLDSFSKNTSDIERSSASGHLVLSDAWGNTLDAHTSTGPVLYYELVSADKSSSDALLALARLIGGSSTQHMA